MLKNSEFWIVTVAAALAAAVALANAFLFDGNRTRQAQVAERNQFIQQSVQLETLYREMVKALADLSVRNQDPALAAMLSSRGITVTASPAPAAAAPAAPAGDVRKGGRP